MRLLAVVVVSILSFSFLAPLTDTSLSEASATRGPPTPDTAVILANAADARFVQDYSTLVKHLRVPWAVVDGPEIPDSARDKDVILIGCADSPYTGEIIRALVSPDEMTGLGQQDASLVLEKDSPWTEERRIYVCLGADHLHMRNAAEDAVRTLMAGAPPESDWIVTTYAAEGSEGVSAYVERLQFDPSEPDLPLADLVMDAGARQPVRISSKQAAEDVERLYYLFSHGYAGYAFFDQAGEFQDAKERILETVSSRSIWKTGAFSALLHEELGFIQDCHLKVGSYTYGTYSHFWCDTTLVVTPGVDGYTCSVEGISHRIVSVNGEDPEAYVYPSLSEQGEPVYRLGILAPEEPSPLMLTLATEQNERRLEIGMQRADYTYYSGDVFQEDDVGGIPVIRVRSFSDRYAEALSRFVQTASAYKGEPVIIVDLRGNHGGNEKWAIEWIRGLTGQRAESVFVFSELHNMTTMVGRVNIFAYLADVWSDEEVYAADIAHHTRMAEQYESGASQPSWRGPIYPQTPLIPNDTLIIVVINDQVASAGEGFVMRVSQAENVVVVGENSMGALTFGNGGAYRLPHSKLMVTLPINFGLFMDAEFREGRGLAPDLWVPAADAVNCAVAAVRNGTLTTPRPLSAEALEEPFVPEDAWARVRRERMVHVAIVALVVGAGGAWGYGMRKRPRVVAIVGGIWLGFGIASLVAGKENPMGYAFLVLGPLGVAWGAYLLWRRRRISTDGAA